MGEEVLAQLRVLLAGTGRWQQQVELSLRDRRTCWHRLNVRIEEGVVMDVQIQCDERLDAARIARDLDTAPREP